MADPDSIVEPETSPPNCLPSISLPRILSGNDRPRNQTFVRLERPLAGSSVKQRELLPPPPPPHEPVPEGAPAHGASLVRSQPAAAEDSNDEDTMKTITVVFDGLGLACS